MARRTALAVALVAALVASGCAVGDPKPTTDVTDRGALLKADIYSSAVGDTEYFWRYGTTAAYGSETPHRTVAISDDDPHTVSEPLFSLSPSTEYHFQVCVKDAEETPPRTNCSTDRTFSTTAAGPAVTVTAPVAGASLPSSVPVIALGTCGVASGDQPTIAVELWRGAEKVSTLTVQCTLLAWSASFTAQPAGDYTLVAKQINTVSGLTGQSAGTNFTLVPPA
jgi:hypothetical protein